MKLQKAANIFFILCFLGFLYIGMMVTIIKPKAADSYFENRTLAALPVLSKASFLNGSWFADWETYLKDHAAGRTSLLKAGTYIDLFVLKRPVVNDIVVGKLLLSYNEYETVDSAAIAEQSKQSTDNLSALSQYVENNGGIFYYVAVSGQSPYDSNAYPAYLNSHEDYYKTVLRYFKADMSERSVNFIDMGDVFNRIGHPDNVYFASDHHFTFDGAMLTYQTLMNKVNSDHHLALPVLTSQDITIKELENPFLGSRMRKLFNLLRTDEKLKIGILNKDIPFTRTNNGNVIPSQVYALPDNVSETVNYTVYMGGDIAETVINTNRPSLPNVLIVGDSYTNAVECLLYTSFNEMRSIDLRWYTDKSLADYIKDYKPDVVILLRDYSVLLSLDGNGTWH
jgi:hypothetical protein